MQSNIYSENEPMNSERELFLYELDGHGYGFQDTTWDNELGRFNDDVLNMTWEMWCASTQRQGYNLVPVEPTEEMYLTGYDCKVQNGSTIDIYKAMIGAVDENML